MHLLGDTSLGVSVRVCQERSCIALTVVFLGTVPFCSRRLGEYVTEDAGVEPQ